MGINVIVNGKKRNLSAAQIFDMDVREFNENHDAKGEFASGSSGSSSSAGAGKDGKSKQDPTKVKLDPYESFVYKDLTSKGSTPHQALNVMINSVEGDHSQLSPGLKSYAKSIGNKPF